MNKITDLSQEVRHVLAPYYYYDYYYYHHHHHLLQLRFHSVAVVLTLITNKNIRKRNNTKTQQIQVHVLPKHPRIAKATDTRIHTFQNPYIHTPTRTRTHILQNKLKHSQYKIHAK